MKTIQEIKNEFEQILTDVSRIPGVASEAATQVATVILREFGKYNRTPEAKSNSNAYNNNGQPATEKQKDALKKWHIAFSEDITKTEASRKLDEAITEMNSKKNGRESPAASFSK